MKKGAHKKAGKEKELLKQVEDYKETLQRLQAEFENFRKRIEKEKEEFVKYSDASFIKELLPIVDSIESCIEKMQNENEIEGVLLIRKQFMDLLHQKGLEEINSLGEKFNPEQHEAMMQDNEPGKEDGVVLEEFQKGYLLHDKVLRPAKVKINKLEGKAEK